jgi:acetylornithine deacetylase/succinyl-diaminopimelate desuccinylase-like protein
MSHCCRALLLVLLSLCTAHHGSAVESDALDRHSERAITLLRDAISRQTVHGEGNVPAYAESLREVFLSAGFEPESLTLVPYRDTASLVVRYAGDGSSGRQPILFSSHMDVVPADPDSWLRHPFELQEDETFFYGRGVLDNKFDVTILTTLFVWLKESGFVPNRDLIIAFTGDEESFQETVQQLTRDHRELIDAEYALVVDGGGGVLDDSGAAIQFQVGFAEKTYATFAMTAKNPGGHSSMPRADNAIYDLARAIQRLEAHTFPVETNEITLTYFARTAPFLNNEVGDAMARLVADTRDAEAIATLRAQPQYVGTLGTTCIPTMLSGGHAENALPRAVSAIVNCRIFPGHTPTEILRELQKVTANPDLEWRVVGVPVTSPASPFNNEIMAAIAASLEPIHPGLPIVPKMGSGTTDGAYLRAAGIPSYSLTGIFINPKDSFAHGLNERVPRAAISESLLFWRAMIDQLATTQSRSATN